MNKDKEILDNLISSIRACDELSPHAQELLRERIFYIPDIIRSIKRIKDIVILHEGMCTDTKSDKEFFTQFQHVSKED